MKINSYNDSIRYLNRFTDYERISRRAKREFNLRNIRRLCEALGDPQDRFPIVHVAGTKGKGSTSAYLAAGLATARLGVGLYLSPHLLDLRERIQVNGHWISKTAFTACMREVADGVRKRFSGSDRPTFFEIMTALAFLHFARERVRWAVIETGLGGRLDATNVVRPKLAVLTRIGLDHREILGRTVGRIAREKAGILKPGVPVICAKQLAPVRRVIRRIAARLRNPICEIGTQSFPLPSGERARVRGFDVRTPWRRWTDIRLSMLGAHQRENAALALAGLDLLAARGLVRLDRRRVRRALAHVALPGRAQYIPGNPSLLVDGAHNADSIRALVQVLREEVAYDRLILIFGCQRDKDARSMLRLLLPLADRAVFTRVDNPRAADPQEFASIARTVGARHAVPLPIESASNPARALSRARKLAGPRDLVCAAGSLYLAGEILKRLKK